MLDSYSVTSNALKKVPGDILVITSVLC